ncbi:MAG TPA: Na+/H+ antiporter NhaA [Frankiaceae bacterium]|nr:Na+/H+ antiporter NhaA [Frankiaceae bacterium]
MRESRARTVVEYLRVETVGGGILLVAAAIALVVANTPLRDAYETFRHTELTLGPITLDLAHWISEGLLALFFFVAGLEVKRELVVGELSDRRRAALPVVAAIAGMVVPAAVYLLVAWGAEGGGRGWAVPMATDIAFALGVLAIAHERYPASLRVLLLSLAVVDDLGAILVIAVFFASGLAPLPLLGALAAFAVYAALQRRRVTAWWLYVPLAVVAWVFIHEAGIHATVAAVALGLLTRVRADEDEEQSPAERLEHLLQPWSAGLVVPLFAFTAAGVALSGDVLRAATGDRIAIAVFLGLVAGKLLGIVGGVRVATAAGATMPPGVRTYDTLALGALGGVGFTVSLLLAELAFEGQTAEHAKMAVLAASLLSSVLATVLLHLRRPDA